MPNRHTGEIASENSRARNSPRAAADKLRHRKVSMKKLVIIDDEKIVVQGLTAIIGRIGLDVEVVGSADNGVDGCRIIRELQPDVVITDIRMPAMDGLSMIEEMHEEFPQTQFVVISGYTEFVYTKRAIRLGVLDYIDKPITIEKVKGLFEKIGQEDRRKSQNEVKTYGDESVINALMIENAGEFVRQTEEFLQQARKNCSFASEYKEECYRFMCVIQGIYAGKKKHYDDFILLPCEKVMSMESEEEAAGYVMQNVHRIASQMEADQKGSNHHVIRQLLQYINENYNRDIGLTELGELVDLNATYLSILFKKEMGKSYVKYLTELRIQKAKEFLAEGKKVNEVAEIVGFSNYRYFCDVFKKHVGRTPSEYRNDV